MIGSRLIGIVFGALVAVAGFLCLNYTNGFGIEHHAEWAAKYGLPAPSYGIFVAGSVLELVGGGIVFRSLRRRVL